MRSWNKILLKHHNEITAYKILAIPLVIWGIFFVFALFRALAMSLTDWNLLRDPSFLGIENYTSILCDESLRKVLANTAIWTAIISIGHNVLGLAMACMLNAIPRGEKLFRALLYWPVLVSAVIGAQMIKYIFNPSPFGFLNSILIFLGLPAKAWYQDPSMALISLIIFPMITGFGIKMLIYQAGLKGIPRSIYEAADLDGASSLRQFIFITLPLLKPVIILNFVMSTIEGFRILAPMQLVTNGGPINSTESMVLSIFKHGFVYNNMGYASAMAFVLFGIILVFSILQIKYQGEDVGYE